MDWRWCSECFDGARAGSFSNLPGLGLANAYSVEADSHRRLWLSVTVKSTISCSIIRTSCQVEKVPTDHD